MRTRSKTKTPRAECLTLEALGEDLLSECVPSSLFPRDLASISATCSALRNACLHRLVLARVSLPKAVVPHAVLVRLSGVGNPWATFRLGLLATYKEQDATEGRRLLRFAAGAGLADASWELFLLSKDAEEKSAMLGAALAAGHKGAIFESGSVSGPNRRTTILRKSFVPHLKGPITFAAVSSVEAQAAALASAEWIEDNPTFIQLEREKLAASCMGGCHRWRVRSGVKRDRRRRLVLGLPDDAELCDGPMSLRKCERVPRGLLLFTPLPDGTLAGAQVVVCWCLKS